MENLRFLMSCKRCLDKTSFHFDSLLFFSPILQHSLFFLNRKRNRKFESSFFLLKQRNVILSISSSILFQLEFIFHPVFFLSGVSFLLCIGNLPLLSSDFELELFYFALENGMWLHGHLWFRLLKCGVLDFALCKNGPWAECRLLTAVN